MSICITSLRRVAPKLISLISLSHFLKSLSLHSSNFVHTHYTPLATLTMPVHQFAAPLPSRIDGQTPDIRPSRIYGRPHTAQEASGSQFIDNNKTEGLCDTSQLDRTGSEPTTLLTGQSNGNTSPLSSLVALKPRRRSELDRDGEGEGDMDVEEGEGEEEDGQEVQGENSDVCSASGAIHDDESEWSVDDEYVKQVLHGMSKAAHSLLA
jgi:hypothetical protein